MNKTSARHSKTKRGPRVTFDLPDPLLKELVTISDRKGHTLASYMRFVLREHVASARHGAS